MPTDFEWQTEDDDWADSEPSIPSPVDPLDRRKPRHWAILLTAVLIFASGFLIYRQLYQHVTETTRTIQSEVAASYRLIQRAAAVNDDELLRRYLSNRSASWTAAQRRLLADGKLFDYRALGLEPGPAGTQARIIDVQVESNMSSASLTSEQVYQVRSSDGEIRQITLRRHDILRRGQERWLWAPPESDFWGATLQRSYQYFQVSCPERDIAFCEGLGEQLDNLFEHACRQSPELSCPITFRAQVTFSSEPSSLAALHDLSELLEEPPNVTLPTVSLIGEPLDPAGEDVLHRGYASLILSSVTARLVAWRCCNQALFYQALLDKQLSQLGLRLWALTGRDYRQLSVDHTTLVDLAEIWNQATITGNVSTLETQRRVYALIDFLSDDVGISTIDMQSQLGQSTDFWFWLRRVSETGYGRESEIQRDWRAFLRQQGDLSEARPPARLSYLAQATFAEP